VALLTPGFLTWQESCGSKAIQRIGTEGRVLAIEIGALPQIAYRRIASGAGRGTLVAMEQQLASITFLVHDYDKAIAYFTGVLRFVLAEDTPMGASGKRWVRVAPPGNQDGTSLLLARAATAEQGKFVGQQGGGRVFLFLQTDDFKRDYHEMKTRGVTFLEEPRVEDYGTVVVFADLYGNKWDLLERKSPARSL
jgi:catechol 2,3-dioxygenase-like lactoylglutathione lyase family enzyme